MNDDRIRWATFYKIYNDSFLSRYSPGGEMGARYELYQSRRFPGMQPFGIYPIHIIVKNGRTTLMGVVGSEMDRRMAEIRAREVSGRILGRESSSSSTATKVILRLGDR